MCSYYYVLLLLFKQNLEECKGLSVNEEAVHVDVHFESYCPDSIDFVTNQLYPAWQKLKDDEIFTFTLYPYGKAHVSRVYLIQLNYTNLV